MRDKSNVLVRGFDMLVTQSGLTQRKQKTHLIWAAKDEQQPFLSNWSTSFEHVPV